MDTGTWVVAAGLACLFRVLSLLGEVTEDAPLLCLRILAIGEETLSRSPIAYTFSVDLDANLTPAFTRPSREGASDRSRAWPPSYRQSPRWAGS